MATYVNDLRLKEITTGDESGTWGTSTNTNLSLIGEAVSYATQESFSSDADVTTTVADGAADPARAFYFKVTSSGSLSATRVLTIAPNTMSRIQIIENATSGSQIINIKQGSGATVNIPNGETRMVYMDGAGSGAAVVDALADINIGGKVTVGVDDTGYDVKLFGATSGKYWLWDESADGVLQYSSLTVGVDNTGYDVKFFGATSGAYMLWDESADDLKLVGAAGLTVAGDIDIDGTANLDVVDIDGATQADGTITVGANDTGYDVKFFGATSGAYMLWDESADDLKLVGAAGLTVAGDADIDGTTNLDAVDIDGAVQADGTITVGADDTGYDVKFFGATASAYMLWDESADDLILAGAARVVVPASGLVIASTAVSSTAAELNLLDGLDRGSILYGNASSATTVLGQGSADQVLTSDGTDISWEDSGGGVDGLTGLVENNSIWLGDDPSGTTDTASYSVALGTTALDAITTGDNNTAIGYGALGANTTASNNTAVGFEALGEVLAGHSNTAVGYRALQNSDGTPVENVAIGYETMGSEGSNALADYNVAVGARALQDIDSGHQQVAVGWLAAANQTFGYRNTAIGTLALEKSTSAADNVAVGQDALREVTNSINNTAVGAFAADKITDGANNICIGAYAGTSTSPAGSITTGDNILCLGNDDITNFYCADSSIDTSDERDKADQTNFSGGLDWVDAMQPITYYWDKRVWYCEATDPTLKITTSIADTFTVDEKIIGQSSKAAGKFKSGSGDTLTFDWVAGTFVADETVIGGISGIEATLTASDFFNSGEITPADILAATPDGTHEKSSINVGFSAQDILAIEQAHGYGSDNDHSLIVDLTEDGVTYGLKYERLVPILISAVKELSAKNDALEVRIEALENA